MKLHSNKAGLYEIWNTTKKMSRYTCCEQVQEFKPIYPKAGC